MGEEVCREGECWEGVREVGVGEGMSVREGVREAGVGRGVRKMGTGGDVREV